jgi:hypothetical protein
MRHSGFIASILYLMIVKRWLHFFLVLSLVPAIKLTGTAIRVSGKRVQTIAMPPQRLNELSVLIHCSGLLKLLQYWVTRKSLNFCAQAEESCR